MLEVVIFGAAAVALADSAGTTLAVVFGVVAAVTPSPTTWPARGEDGSPKE